VVRIGSLLRQGRWLGLCLLFLAGAVLAAASAPASMSASTSAPVAGLSAAEQQWLASHPALRVGLTRDFPPFYVRDPSSDRAHGFVLELLARWTQRLGVTTTLHHYDSFDELRAALQRGEVDLTPFAALDRGRASGLPVGAAVMSVPLVVAARRDVPDISPTADFAGRRVAIEMGSSVDRTLATRFPQLRLERHATAREALQAVATGGADIFIGFQQAAVYHIEHELLANVELRASLGPVPMGPVVAPGRELLASLLDKAAAEGGAAERDRLARRWLPAGSTRLPLPAASAQLSEPEQRWVAQNAQLRVGYDPSFAPVSLRGPLGDFTGFGPELLRLLAGKAGLTVTQEVGLPFAELYERGRQGEIDVLVGMARTVTRREDYDFVGPFLSTPTVLFTRAGEQSQVADTPDIGVRRLALLKGHFLLPELRLRHPRLSVVELDRQDQVMTAVAEGAADVGLGNLYVVNELLERRFAGRVALSGMVSGGDSELYLGVPRGRPELTRVLARTLESVNESEWATLRARWLAREVPTQPDWRELLSVVGPLVAVPVLVALLLWIGQRRLRRAHEAEQFARRQAEDSIASRGRFLAYLAHELRGALGAVSSGAQLLRRQDDPEVRDRLLQAIGNSASSLLQLLETTLGYEQSLQGRLKLQPTAVSLGVWWRETLDPARLASLAKGLAFVEEHRGLDEASVHLDGVRLRQVVQNLLNNALKFTTEGEVRAGAWVTDGPGPPRLRIEVHDSGPGLSATDRGQLFQAYAQGEQGRRAHQGAGLGLAISAQIVQAMGGEIRCLAAERGAHFVVEVPLGHGAGWQGPGTPPP
jgi:two-component system, NarL family, sensor histidine kinase EvgS